MTPWEFVLAVSSGFAAGVLSGAFGVGGGILMTPAISTLLNTSGSIALFTPLPVIIPTAITGASRYWRAGQVDVRAAAWVAIPGAVAAIFGALATELVPARALLIATALVLAWQGVRLIRGTTTAEREPGSIAGWEFVAVGAFAGAVSGLLGIGGGLIMVPAFASVLGMPLKRALGTSLFVMPVIALAAGIEHIFLGNIDWAIAGALLVGVIPGALLGARLALRAKDRSLQMAVGTFLLIVAVIYGITQLLGAGS